jgi:hypothetical protein
MARLPHNIEKGSRFREYILHMDGAQRIVGIHGAWRTIGLASLTGRPIYVCGRTLRELADNAAAQRAATGA